MKFIPAQIISHLVVFFVYFIGGGGFERCVWAGFAEVIAMIMGSALWIIGGDE